MRSCQGQTRALIHRQRHVEDFICEQSDHTFQMYFHIRIKKHLEALLKTIENIKVEGKHVTPSLDKSILISLLYKALAQSLYIYIYYYIYRVKS